MEPGDRERFGACLLAASELYGKPMSDAGMAIWWSVLSRFDVGAVESAFRAHFGDPDRGQFMPKPSDIVRGITGSHEDAAYIAWAKVMQMLRSGDHYYLRVEIEDGPTRLAIQDLGGLGDIGRAHESRLPMIAKQFFALFRKHAFVAQAGFVDVGLLKSNVEEADRRLEEGRLPRLQAGVLIADEQPLRVGAAAVSYDAVKTERKPA